MEKKVFKIEVGNIPEDEIDDYVKNVMKRFMEIPEGELPDFKLPDYDIDLASEFDARNKEE